MSSVTSHRFDNRTAEKRNLYNYNNYAGSGNMVIDLYSPNSANTQMYVHSNSTNGMRQVKLTATNTCGNYAEDFVFYVPGMAKAYPNPAKDILVVDFAEYTKVEELPSKILLFPENNTNPLKIIKTSELSDQQGFENSPLIKIDVSNLPAQLTISIWFPGRLRNVRLTK